MKPTLLFISLSILLCFPLMGRGQAEDTSASNPSSLNDTIRDGELPSLSTTFYNEGVNMEAYYANHMDIQNRRLRLTSVGVVAAGSIVTIGCVTLFGILGGTGKISVASAVTGSLVVSSVVMAPCVLGVIYLKRKANAIEDSMYAMFPVNDRVSLAAVRMNCPALSSNAFGCGVVINF